MRRRTRRETRGGIEEKKEKAERVERGECKAANAERGMRRLKKRT